MAFREQQLPGVFRGDGERMLTALIQACEAKPVSKKADPAWFGRPLVPWVDDVANVNVSELQSLEGPRRAPGSQMHDPASFDKVQQHKRAHPKRSKAASPQRSFSPRNVNSGNVCACPALAASPKPEAVPMPGHGLMSRALLRGRSPSPPKDAAIAHLFAHNTLQQLVHPVAA